MMHMFSVLEIFLFVLIFVLADIVAFSFGHDLGKKAGFADERAVLAQRQEERKRESNEAIRE